MYVTMLDASKVFDKDNHSKLFTKLIDRGCPSFIVRILYYWYRTQQFTVRWCCTFSEFVTVSNGVKQGGILSPHHFNVYMDDLSINLNKLQIGCLNAGTPFYAGWKNPTYLIYIFTTRHVCIFLFIYIFFSLHVLILFIMCVYIYLLVCIYNNMGSCLK